MHSFDEKTRKIFHILTLFTFFPFWVELICLFKEAVSETVHYWQWNYKFFTLLCFSKCFSFPIAKKGKKKTCGHLYTSVVPVTYCIHSVWHCPLWPFLLAFLPAEKLCMALLCRSYCESKYIFHWNNQLYVALCCVDISYWKKKLKFIKARKYEILLCSIREKIQIPNFFVFLGKMYCGENC